MEIKIKRLRLRNFKGVRDADYLFNGRNATIEGPNGSGKSTVFDAFTWLLFGKDHRDQTSSTFEIKTIDPATGRPYPREDHWVEAELVNFHHIEGILSNIRTNITVPLYVSKITHTLKKTISDTWSKTRTNSQKVSCFLVNGRI